MSSSSSEAQPYQKFAADELPCHGPCEAQGPRQVGSQLKSALDGLEKAMPSMWRLAIPMAMFLACGTARPHSPEPDIALDGVLGFCVFVRGFGQAFDPDLTRSLEAEFSSLLGHAGLNVVAPEACLDGWKVKSMR